MLSILYALILFVVGIFLTASALCDMAKPRAGLDRPALVFVVVVPRRASHGNTSKIGRASCRERV